MKLLVHGKQMDITGQIEEYVEKRMAKLERHMPQVMEVRAELSHNQTRANKDKFTCQLTMRAPKRILRAEEADSTIFAAIDRAVDKMDRQITKVAGRYKKHRRTSLVDSTDAILSANADAALATAQAPVGEEIEMPVLGQVVRRKQFVLHPLTEDEAVDQMELLGHDFFMFYNAADDNVNMIYRRKDGNYGLLQPRFE